MSGFTLSLRDFTDSQVLPGVCSFVGEDASGSFGILPGHGRFMTSLVFGLARFRTTGDAWNYLALPGGVLYMAGDELRIATRRYLLDDDYRRVSERLRAELLAEEQALAAVRSSLRRMEDELFRRLWQLEREA